MRHFLVESGFLLEDTVTDSWMNRACIDANFSRWARKHQGDSLPNEPEVPVAAWTLARKPH